MSAALFAGAELGPLLPPLVRAVQARRGGGPRPARDHTGRRNGGLRRRRVPDPARLAAPDPERERRQRAAIRQRVIADITERANGRGPAELVRELQEPWPGAVWPPSRTWLRSVAADAAVGHLYVISEEAVRDAGLEMPHSEGG